MRIAFAQVRATLLILGLLTLNACVSRPAPVEPSVVEERIVIDGQVQPFPNEPRIQTETLDGTPTMSQTVRNLVQQAITHKDNARFAEAAAALERAIRLEARNPVIWFELAEVRLNQQQFQQAIQFSRKSLALSGREQNELTRRNWYLLSRAHDAIGQARQAEEYRAKLRAG